jgi:uncharacterized ubiquitin-like protein YukD
MFPDGRTDIAIDMRQFPANYICLRMSFGYSTFKRFTITLNSLSLSHTPAEASHIFLN